MSSQIGFNTGVGVNDLYAQMKGIYDSASDHNRVIATTLGNLMMDRRVDSILDLCPQASIMMQLASSSQRYVAIAADSEHFEQLQSARRYVHLPSLLIREISFPKEAHIEFDKPFDCVLALPGFPVETQARQMFFSAAWEQIKVDGTLAVVMQDASEMTQYGKLLSGVGLRSSAHGSHAVTYRNQVVTMLKAFNKHIACQDCISNVVTDTVEQMVAALAFVYGVGDMNRAKVFHANRMACEYLRRRLSVGSKTRFAISYEIFFLRKKAA
jgi:hypothetical protein